jgi:hypothetical protein
MWQDWLPNEVKIQYRGPTWALVYSSFYEPVARKVGMVLKPKQWMRSRKTALGLMHAEFFPTVDSPKLNVVRAARHSKFPECTDCQMKKRHYRLVLADSRSTAEQVAAAHKDLH